MNMKRAAGEKACELIQEGMLVGLGTGSTVFYTIEALGRRVREGLKVTAVATSKKTEQLASANQIPLISLNKADEIDLTIDGADEVDADFNGIKGGGGALLREKMVALSSKQNIWIVDASKVVEHLGKFPLPVEVIPFGYKKVETELAALDLHPELRLNQTGEIYQTDNQNYILDLKLGEIKNAAKLAQKLDSISGIVEHGLFLDIADRLIIGNSDGTVTEKRH
ncbi:ribose-5-phosphate isomerase A [Listeria floridensis FSL S10-1187]|uniref:Ribose-5-phosphate isomerase A n=1 Tax=Listeria floridensis FSL S10-1187 TaxID=1265817 RepID=A0ABP3AZQ0_9LIST|nr:ribose-5-phosphate isomerase RpiA [Listeria floridensis]EUJ32199.1 ribose-5-phosphate isomerase A [Listeria floridensis FSL S10-1187]